MSVTVIAHFPVADVKKAVAGLQDNAALLEEITEDTKSVGIVHHTFVAGDSKTISDALARGLAGAQKTGKIAFLPVAPRGSGSSAVIMIGSCPPGEACSRKFKRLPETCSHSRCLS